MSTSTSMETVKNEGAFDYSIRSIINRNFARAATLASAQKLTNKHVNGFTTVAIPVVGDDLAAAVQGWQNPEAVDIIVLRAILDIETESTGASTLDAGVTAVSATTSSDTLLDGISGAAVAVFDSMNAALDAGANAKAQKLAVGGWITVAEASGAAEGLVGTLYVQYQLASA